MALSLKEALTIEPFSTARIIVGTHLLDREVTSVNIIEVPTVSRWMRGGEVLFTSGFAFQGDIEGACRILEDLAAKQIAALVLKTGEYMTDIPDQIVRCCERVGLPLLQIPQDMPYFSVMQPLLERLIDEQVWTLRHIEDAHNTLIQTMLTDGTLFGLSAQLKSLIRQPILLMDTRQRILASSEIDPSEAKDLLASYRDTVKRTGYNLANLSSFRCARLDDPEGLCHYLTVPVDVNWNRHGYLVIGIGSRTGIPNYDIISLEHAGMLFSLMLQQQQALQEKEWQLKGECLDDLIWGNYSDEEIILTRSAHLGVDLTRHWFIAAIHHPATLDREDPGPSLSSIHFDHSLQESIRHVLNQARLPSLMYNKGDSIVFLSVLEAQEDPRIPLPTLEEIMTLLRRKKLKGRFSMGVSTIKKMVEEANPAYKESLTALRCGMTMFQDQAVVTYDELGAFRLLSQVANTNVTQSYFRQYLDPLIAYDREKQGDLVKTLKSYFEHNGNLTRISEALFLHKNSISYRLQKIEDLTGCKLRDFESAFQLQLCLKLEPILNCDAPLVTD